MKLVFLDIYIVFVRVPIDGEIPSSMLRFIKRCTNNPNIVPPSTTKYFPFSSSPYAIPHNDCARSSSPNIKRNGILPTPMTPSNALSASSSCSCKSLLRYRTHFSLEECGIKFCIFGKLNIRFLRS